MRQSGLHAYHLACLRKEENKLFFRCTWGKHRQQVSQIQNKKRTNEVPQPTRKKKTRMGKKPDDLIIHSYTHQPQQPIPPEASFGGGVL
jgi:hypothetical protein